MDLFIRGIKNAFRNTIRTISVVFILSLSVGLALAMLLAHQAVQSKIDAVKSNIGNFITITPAGSRGFAGEGNPLTAANAATIQNSAHVIKVVTSIIDRWNTISPTAPATTNSDTNGGGTTSLTSPVIAGAIGRRFGGGGGNPNFTPPIRVMGTNDPTNIQISGVNNLKITAGSNIDGTGTKNEALLGKDLAAKNNLAPGGTFTAYGQTITVSGVYDSGNTFTNADVIMPLATLQTLSGQPGDVSSVIAQVDSISNVPAVVTDLQNKLGSAADVVSSQDSSSQAVSPLVSIDNISQYSLVGALAAGSVIIFLIMLMIVRERRKEIGVLKAIGASNIKVVSQFITEALVFTLLGSAIGVLLGIVFGNSVTQLLVTNAASAATPGGGPGGGGGGGAGGAFQGFRALANNPASLVNIHTVADYHILLYGLGAAILIAVIGSSVPAYITARIRPAEVLRSE